MFLQEGGGLRQPPPLFCNANIVILIIIAILMIVISIVILIVTLHASARGRSTPEEIFSENVATLHAQV